MSVISGKKFNEIYGNKKFIKLVTKSLRDESGIQYTDGKNIDTSPSKNKIFFLNISPIHFRIG